MEVRGRGGPRRAALHLVLAFAAVAPIACGRKGPPLPPLVRIPAAPAEMTATRRGETVDLQFNVPSANTDGTRPANVERVDVYAFTGSDIKDEVLYKIAPKVASVQVKAPRDPNATVEPDEPAADIEPLAGPGLDQGAKAHLQETLTARSLVPLEIEKTRTDTPEADRSRPQPLLGPPPSAPVRTYVSVGITTRGRKGPFSPRVRVPLVSPPPPPPAPTVSFNETTITVAWEPPGSTPPVASGAAPAPAGEPAGGALLPSTPIGLSARSFSYHVYDVPPGDQASKPTNTRLTSSPVALPTYADTRIEWGADRCYAVRTVETIGEVSLESDATPPRCVTLVDTFAPLAPKQLQAVASERSIHLIWQPNAEKDLLGYVVLRGTAADTLEPVTPAPIQDTIFNDGVQSGQHYFYAVKAVDKAGNVSPASNQVDETARE